MRLFGSDRVAKLMDRDPQALRGKWVYDDAGSVAKNVVVNGQVPWKDAFTRDFWGTPMEAVQSHKSFRPLTTLSFRLNQIISQRMGTATRPEIRGSALR